MNLEPDQFPEPRVYRDQLCRPVYVRPHTCQDGRRTLLAVWESQCAHCGETFTFSTPLRAGKFQPNRLCRQHRRPGARV